MFFVFAHAAALNAFMKVRSIAPLSANIATPVTDSYNVDQRPSALDPLDPKPELRRNPGPKSFPESNRSGAPDSNRVVTLTQMLTLFLVFPGFPSGAGRVQAGCTRNCAALAGAYSLAAPSKRLPEPVDLQADQCGQSRRRGTGITGLTHVLVFRPQRQTR